MNTTDSPIPATGHPIVDSTIAITVGIGLGLSSLAFGLWALWVKLVPLLHRIEGFAKTSAEQTANDHGVSQNPNLRDDIDSKHFEVIEAIRDLKESHSEIRADICGLRVELRNDREATREIGEKLDAHIRDKSTFEPRLIALENRYTKPPA